MRPAGPPRKRPVKNPLPAEIRRARRKAGLTQGEAAELVHAARNAWESWEQGLRRMHPGLWELFLIRLDERGKGDEPGGGEPRLNAPWS